MTIDTLEYADNLRAAGVSEPAAKAHAEALKQAIAGVERDARAESQYWRNGMEKELTEVKSAVKDIDARLAKVERRVDVLMWMGGVAIALLIKIAFFG